MTSADPQLPIMSCRADATARGLSGQQVDRRLRSRTWTRLRHGYFAPEADLPEHVRWRAEVAAHLRAHRRLLVLSHAHAARAWGLPAPLDGWGAPTFTGPDGPPRNGRLVIRTAPLCDTDVVRMRSVPVTSLARTVLDCARSLPPRDALAIADAALHGGRLARADVEAVLARARGWPGVPLARRVLAVADGRRESAFESWSAWTFDEHGVPRPWWQVEVCDERGAFIGRVDALWPGGVAGEADGRAKYRLASRQRGGADAETLAAVLDEERLREMGLRRAGLVVVRRDARDVLVRARAAALAEHLRAELAGADRRAFRGRLHLP